MTVKQLKLIVADWPEEMDNGEPTEVWIETGKFSSSPCTDASKLNCRRGGHADWTADLLLGYLGQDL